MLHLVLGCFWPWEALWRWALRSCMTGCGVFVHTVVGCFAGALQPHGGARAGGAAAGQAPARLLQQPEARAAGVLALGPLPQPRPRQPAGGVQEVGASAADGRSALRLRLPRRRGQAAAPLSVSASNAVFQGCCPALRAAEALPVPAALLQPLAPGRLLPSGETPLAPPSEAWPRLTPDPCVC